MSEQDPLLPTQNDSEGHSQGTAVRYRERTAAILESQRLHQFVIALITVDAICVIIDIGYSFLSESCTPVEGPDAPKYLQILSLLSLFITTFFLFEIPITLWALGLEFYNPFSQVHHATLHLFDAIIIVTTFILEIVLKGKERELAGLLILFRLWRLVKLVGGIAVGAGELEEEADKQLRAAQTKLQETEAALSETRKENEELKKKLASNETSTS